jgi:hypothetical protein
MTSGQRQSRRNEMSVGNRSDLASRTPQRGEMLWLRSCRLINWNLMPDHYAPLELVNFKPGRPTDIASLRD